MTKEKYQSILSVECLAQKAYDKYSKGVGGKAFNGDPLPSWDDFAADPSKKKQVQGWLDVGQFIYDQTVSVLEFEDKQE
jgi:hypothetical protein